MAKIYLHKKLKNLIIVCVVFAIVFILLSVLLLSDSFSNEKGYLFGDYNDVISSVPNISLKNPKINEIAMLGSHDSFSDKITSSSAIDPANSGIMGNKVFAAMTKGLFVRYSVTQEADALGQLSLGVRYFDIRASLYNGEWWTKHGRLSGKLDDYIKQILQFSSQNDGEVIILDFQHVYYGGLSVNAFFDYLSTVTVEGKSLYDYVPYYASEKPIDSLRYNDVCNGGKTGLVMLFNCEDYDYGFEDIDSTYKKYFYDRENDVRSLWHPTCNSKKLIKEIDNETALLNSTTKYDGKLRINQTQHSFQADGIFNAIFGWSLLNIADDYNLKLLENSNFNAWLEAMPIFMVDFATSKKGNFNQKVNDAIFKYNENLWR